MPARTDRRSRGLFGSSERGLTLVEAIVACVVMVAIALGLYALLDSSNKLAKQETNVAEAQQSARVGIYEVSRLIRQARVGQLYYGNAILPVTNNAPGGTSLTDLSGTRHYIRKGTDVVAIRGILLGDRYSMTTGDATCSGTCNSSTSLTITIRSTANNGVQNYPSGTLPAIANRTRPFYFVVADGSTQTVNAGANMYLVPLYYVGLVDTAGTWYTSTADTFTFSMNPQDPGARKYNASASGAPALEKPYAGGIVDEILFFVDEGSSDGSSSNLDTHPALAQAMFDPSSGNYDIQPLVDEAEDFQVAYGVDGVVAGIPSDRGISPASIDTSAVNKDEWVGNVASEVATTLTLSSSDPKHVDAFLDTSIASGPPNPSLATPALRSIWLSLVVKASEPDFKYEGPGATGIKTLDSTAVSLSASTATGRRYRRRLQSFAVALRNYQ
ncbi:MAG TPA: PilW family protein [Thermoanaerobaculia bacterium]|nr:PilW family protein [Thermoanaerobaculia bacterium]